MAMLKIVAAGAAGFILYRAWQRHQASSAPATVADQGDVTPPHGDPVLVGARLDAEQAREPRPAAQYSRGFGEP